MDHETNNNITAKPGKLVSTTEAAWQGAIKYIDAIINIILTLQYVGSNVTGNLQVEDTENGVWVDFGPVSGSLSGATTTVTTLGGATVAGTFSDGHLLGTMTFPAADGHPELSASMDLVPPYHLYLPFVER